MKKVIENLISIWGLFFPFKDSEGRWGATLSIGDVPFGWII